MSKPNQRSRAFFVLCAVCVLAIVVFSAIAVRRSRMPIALPAERPRAVEVVPIPPTPPESPSQSAPAELPKAPPAAPPPSRLFFRANALGPNYGKLAMTPLDALDQPEYSPDLSCDRLYFTAGTGVCLASDRGVFTTYSAVSFDAKLRRGWTIPLNGIPSRVRVSPSGRLASITVFLTGHSYASLNFSTQTVILDASRGTILADLDKFTVQRDGETFQSPDFNFWGVTFARDDNRFYATLWSKGKTYLVDCDLRNRTARVIHDGVECPSLSPDNTRIAFKKRIQSGRMPWLIYVLELATMTEVPLGEIRSVDDQVEWLDNNHVLYALSESEMGSSASTDIWVLETIPSSPPRILLRGGYSPAVAAVPKGLTVP